MIFPVLPDALPPAPRRNDDAGVRAAAEGLETAFVAEFLKSAGVGRTPSVTGGGAGEDQFGSFLRQLQAEQIVRAGGLGLTDAFVAALSSSGKA